jgi:hypothetical protein
LCRIAQAKGEPKFFNSTGSINLFKAWRATLPLRETSLPVLVILLGVLDKNKLYNVNLSTRTLSVKLTAPILWCDVVIQAFKMEIHETTMEENRKSTSLKSDKNIPKMSHTLNMHIAQQ